MAEIFDTIRIQEFHRVYWKIYSRFLLETEEYKSFDKKYHGRTAEIDQAALFMSWVSEDKDHIFLNSVLSADDETSNNYGIIFGDVGFHGIRYLYSMSPYGDSYYNPEDIFWSVVDKDKALLTKMTYG